MLAAIVFDFDGTIAETERLGHRVAYNAAFSECGLDWVWDDALYAELLTVGGGKERIAHFIERYQPTLPAFTDQAAFIRNLHERKQIAFTSLAPQITIRPGIRRLIAEARAAGIRLAIATTAATAGVEAVIGRDRELHAAFEFIAAGDVVAAKKPAPDIYLYVLEQLNLAAHDCIAIEDAAIGLRASRAAGLVTLVTCSDYTRDENFDGAAAVLSDLGEPSASAQTLAGPAPDTGVVTIDYLRRLLHVVTKTTVGFERSANNTDTPDNGFR